MTTPYDERSEQELLSDLGARFGIAPEYYDNWGHRHPTSEQTLRAILKAMGLRTESRDDLLSEVRASLESSWRAVCDPVQVVKRDGSQPRWSLRLPSEAREDATVRIHWEVRDEGGRFHCGGAFGPDLVPHESFSANGRRYVRFELPVPSGLPIGYYDLLARAQTSSEAVEGRLRLIVVPPRCFLPPSFTEGAKLWGLAVQLYALRSPGDWGVGDFGDLVDLVEWANKELGAGIIGLNPLHALKNSRPYHISPYSPDSRLYLNVLYLDVEQIPELQESVAARRLLANKDFRSKLDALRTSETVDYDEVLAAKRRVLELLFQTFQKVQLTPRTSRGRAFEQFVREEGEALERFALFQALTEKFRRELPKVWSWTEWPEPYRDPRSAAVQAFRKEQESQVQFHQYLQWVASAQLGGVHTRSRQVGMAVGLYLDQALGSSRSGSDAWAFQDVLALGADCGAPPDAFSLQGQNWGLPPADPVRLRASGYRMFIELLRKNLKYGGAIRLDHVMALIRLFWIPRGLPAKDGTYVLYPADDLLGILALESVRHRAVVVGEDLGTVPDEVREKLTAYGVLSYRVFYFEREPDGSWKAPATYPAQAVAVVTTHDLPTLTGFWKGYDIQVRARLGLFPDDQTHAKAWDERRRDKRLMLQALQGQGLLPEGVGSDPETVPAMTEDLCQAIHTFLARTPSWIVLVALEDCLGILDQTNLPGTLDTHPNWSLKIPVSLDELRQEAKIRGLAALLNGLRPFTSGQGPTPGPDRPHG